MSVKSKRREGRVIRDSNRLIFVLDCGCDLNAISFYADFTLDNPILYPSQKEKEFGTITVLPFCSLIGIQIKIHFQVFENLGYKL